MDEENTLNMKPKTKGRGNKSINFGMMPKSEDIAVVEAAVASTQNTEEKPITDEEFEKALVLSDNVTSVDFMIPSEEREILQENLNLYSNLEEVQKVLNIAKRNKKLSEDIKTLDLISSTTTLADNIVEIMNDEYSLDRLLESFREKIEKGESAKAYKELAMTYKLALDAREEMLKRISANSNKKNARIALKFTNDNGEDFQLGVDI